MSTKLVKVIPVLESADIARDIAWYKEKTGFEISFLHEKMYAGLYRDVLKYIFNGMPGLQTILYREAQLPGSK